MFCPPFLTTYGRQNCLISSTPENVECEKIYYCYRRSVVFLCMVCLLDAIVIPTKTDEPTEMSFELWIRVARGTIY